MVIIKDEDEAEGEEGEEVTIIIRTPMVSRLKAINNRLCNLIRWLLVTPRLRYNHSHKPNSRNSKASFNTPVQSCAITAATSGILPSTAP